jgi:hypothetical protein
MSAATTTRRKAKPQSKAKGTSQRQTEANQRNARKSTGPRTAEGKGRSRHNAVTHGLTAESTILPGEDINAFLARRKEIIDGTQPRNEVEAILLEQIARCEWKSMRADRAASARLSAQLRDEYDATNYNDKDEVIELGQHLLNHPSYPLPVSSPNDKGYLGKAPLADVPGDPHHPARLVLKLEQTVRGCDWLLGRWAGLKLRLDIEGLWLMAEGYEMIRLLGKYTIDMASDYQVEMLMLASSCVAADGKPEDDKNETEPKSFCDKLDESQDPSHGLADRMKAYCTPWARTLAKRPLDRLMPENVAEARRWLTVAIDDEVNRLTRIRAHRQQFADLDWAEAPARLAFETGTEGDRLRRYDLSRDRVLIRAIGKFVEVRKASIAGTFNLLDYDLDELREFDEPKNPNDGILADPSGNVGNSRNGQAEVTGFVRDQNVADPRPELATEADGSGKIAAPIPESAEGCDDGAILRNEPKSFVSGPLSVVRCEAETADESDATGAVARENAANEFMLANDGEDDKNVRLSAGMNDADETFESEIDRERASKWLWDQVAILAPIRAEDLRKLNAECRQEEREAKAAARRSRGLERKNGPRGSDVVQSEVKPTIVAGACDPAVPTTVGLTEAGYNATIVAAVCDPAVPTAAGLIEAGYNAGPIAAADDREDHHVNTATDDGQLTTDKTGEDSCDRERDEIAASRARAERIKAERFALWKEQKLRTMREAKTKTERPPP